MHREAITGVYRCICRHLNYLDPSLIKQVRSQFERRRKFAKYGHIKAAYELEEQLRAAAEGKTQLADILRVWAPKHGKRTQPPKIERNAYASHMVWLSSNERRHDRANIAPTKGSLEYAQVHVAAGLCNARANYLRKTSVKSPDLTIVDTVLAPYSRKAKARHSVRKRLERESTPRKVSLRFFYRQGSRVYVLHTQGIKPKLERFSALRNIIDRNSRRIDRLRGNPNAPNKKDIVKMISQVQENQRSQHAILRRRAEIKQRHWNHIFRLKKQNIKRTAQKLTLSRL